uniref:Sulfatase N-terminal domain-containing protein n=1 Tax=Strigamia maritima TaxID=126957 RepID=T1JBW3_STRMM
MKPTTEKRCNKNYINWVRETKDVIRERLSVTIVGLDSVSRLNMLRHLIKTYTYLSTFGSLIDLYGYTKLGDNTFPNVVPLLTGQFVKECWNETFRHKSLNYLKLIWKEFSQNGYRTLFGEDAPYHATFNYLKSGFHNQPTDYYLRPISLAIEESLVKNNSKANCINTRSETEFVLQWLTDFLNVFQNKPTFSYVFNTQLTHNHINYVGYGDEPYYKFFKNYNDSNFNNNSILIFFSDHGLRFGKILDSYVGKIEERMPFFLLLFPPWFPLKYPLLWRNIQINKHRLTTPFDIYQTLRDIVNFTGDAPVANVSERGISLFREIPSDRTCEDAAILPHWCTCHVKHSVPLNSSHVTKAAGQLLSRINGLLLEESSKCVKLSLDKVVDARVSGISDELLKFKDSRKKVIGRKVNRMGGMADYLLTILAIPSGGLFEGTVRYFEASGRYQVMGDVSRINMYGNQSACIDKASLIKFCYCNQEG